ncbi:MAG: hypothetical protein ABUS57_16725 [Pseudomonadota bacterium]
MPEALPSVANALAEHGWIQADTALARGWRENAVLERELRALARTQAVRSSERVAEKVAGLIEQCLLVSQSLALAGGQRGLALLGGIGDETKFDAERHAAVGAEPARGAPVRVVAPGIIAESRRAIVVKADVAPKRPPAKVRPSRAPRRRG